MANNSPKLNMSSDIKGQLRQLPISAISATRPNKAPNISVGKMESRIMFSSNNTKEWLERKSAMEKEKTIMSAMKKGRDVRVQDKTQTAKVSQSIKDKNETSRKMLSEKENNKREKIEEVIEHVLNDAIIENTSSIDKVISEKKSVSSRKNFLILRF